MEHDVEFLDDREILAKENSRFESEEAEMDWTTTYVGVMIMRYHQEDTDRVGICHS
jgi:hypothetical protein